MYAGSVQFSLSVVSDSLQPHKLQHSRLPRPSPTPRVHPNPVQFSSVAQSCPTLCDSINCSTPGLPVHHQLPESTQTHAYPTISSSVIPFSSCPQTFPASGSSQMSQFFAFGGQSIGVSAAASVLQINSQD